MGTKRRDTIAYKGEAMKFGIAGYGKMSSAIAQAAEEFFAQTGTKVYIYTPSLSSVQRAKENHPQAHFCMEMKELCRRADMVLLGVKPQIMPMILRKHREDLRGKSVLSIAAGLSSESIRAMIEDAACVQRIMPNLGVLVSEGMTVFSEETTLEPADHKYAIELFEFIGKVKILPENLMDIASVLAGSGGAFYTMFVEAIAEAGLRRGLRYQDALDMVLQNNLGTLLLLQNGHDSRQLRLETCSPAGTTVEGVSALEKNGLKHALHYAVEASFLRSKELNKND
jgi:pyrroline-5-carboxylate reductase